MPTGETTRPATGICLRGLTKSFTSPQGPVHAVRSVDIDISPGETVALLGPNGAGESTTIDMLLQAVAHVLARAGRPRRPARATRGASKGGP